MKGDEQNYLRPMSLKGVKLTDRKNAARERCYTNCLRKCSLAKTLNQLLAKAPSGKDVKLTSFKMQQVWEASKLRSTLRDRVRNAQNLCPLHRNAVNRTVMLRQYPRIELCT